MAEEKQTAEPAHISLDDADVLRYVLKNVRGITPVSVYNQADYIEETAE